MTRLNGKIEKGWGHEYIWISNDYYCSKFLHFNKDAKFSMHFHATKMESWYVISGEFLVEWIDTTNATTNKKIIKTGDIWHNNPLSPHRIICLQEGTILEVSTADSVEDNYRVAKGDSQL